ncbi:MAG: hypothetical protein DRJ42_28080 [Deltaproteobacteria bacterium]|nr:MAG: hypothetical protein DRJ42_28080 [Deltaproteobacteria bacterium]
MNPALLLHLAASLGGVFAVVGGFVLPDARVVAAGGLALIIGGMAAFGSGRTLTPTGWAAPEDLAAITDPEHRAATERAVAFLVGSLLIVVGGLILVVSVVKAVG